MIGNIISISFNALLGAGLGAYIVLILKSRIVKKFLYSEKMILIFLMMCGSLGVYFNVAQYPDMLLNAALIDRHPLAIAGVGALMLSFLISSYKFLKMAK